MKVRVLPRQPRSRFAVVYAGPHQGLLVGIDLGTWPPETPAAVENNLVIWNTIRVTGNVVEALGVHLFDLGTLEYGFPTTDRDNVVEDNSSARRTAPRLASSPASSANSA